MKSAVQYVAKFEIIFIQKQVSLKLLNIWERYMQVFIICVFISELQGFGGTAPDPNSYASVIVI